MKRFRTDKTDERIVPLENDRAVQVLFPDDMTVEEWNRVTDVVLQGIHLRWLKANDKNGDA